MGWVGGLTWKGKNDHIEKRRKNQMLGGMKEARNKMRDKARKNDKKNLAWRIVENDELKALEKSLSQHPKWILGQYTEI